MTQQKLDLTQKTNNLESVNQDEPELRFPEFNEPWKMCKLEDICAIQDGTHSTPDYTDEGVPFFSVETITSNADPKFISMEEHEKLIKRCQPKKGDILLTRIGTLAKSKLIDWDYDFSIYVSLALLSSIKIDSEFLNQYIKTPNYQKDFLSKSLLLAVPQKINLKDLKETKINYPSIQEQQKIASLLRNIDKKIELLEKNYENKNLIKNYFLNKILTEDFEKNKEWDFKPLNEITFFQEGPGVRNYQYVNEGVKLLNVGNFVENQLLLETTDRYISEEEAYGMYKHFLVDEGDLLIACSGIRAEYFDEKIAFAEKDHLPLCMNTSTMRFKSLDENYLNLNYLKWYFQTTLFKKQIFRVLTGSAQFNFGPTHLKYLKIIVPPVDYQIKISKFFDLIKEDLDCRKMQIEEMKKFKKGILQKMFV